MVSLAFVISFVVSAVVLLIGISIYADVSDSMIGTFGDPILIANGTTGGITTTDTMYSCENNGDIQKRNKSDGTLISGNAPVISGMTGEVGCLGLAEDPTNLGTWYALIQNSPNGGARWLVTIDPETGIGSAIGGNDMFTLNGSYGNSLTINSTGTIFVTDGNQGSYNALRIVDKTDATSFVTCTMNVLSGTAGTNILSYNFNTDQLVVLTDSGFAQFGTFHVRELTDVTTATCGETLPTTSYNDSNEYQINVSNGLLGHAYSWAYHTEDNAWYSFTGDSTVNADPLYSIISSSYSATLLNTDVDSTLNFGSGSLLGGAFLKAIAFDLEVGVASPPIYEDQVPESFAQANSIALTVLGVLPVALFFALFTILSPRVDGE
jgi:hypothetical protein